MKKQLSLFACVMMLLLTLSTAVKAQKKSKQDWLVTISTSFGDMNLVLYDEAPQHKANFIKLARQGFYDSLLFHRVIKDFMIQGGDPNSKNAPTDRMLGDGDVGYTVPAEFNDSLFHKKGVLAAARNNNPEKASSGCQFYIVQGRKFTEEELNILEARSDRAIPAAQREVYKTIGGTPHLDGNYTVYGEVVKGLEVVDKIAEQETGSADRPVQDIRMKVKVAKMPKKKITKVYGYVYK